MVIGFDAKRLFNNFTGLGNYSRTLLANLNRYHPGNSLLLYTPKIRSHPALVKFTDPPYTIRSPKIPLPLWRSFFVKEMVAADKLQIYHGLSHELPFDLANKVAQVVTVHDLIFKRYPSYYNPVDRRIYEVKLKHSLERADAVVAISKQTRADLLHFYPGIPENKIRLVYQSCDPLYYEAEAPPEKPDAIKPFELPSEYFLYVGSLSARKNLPNLIQALSILPPDLKLPLVIVGGGKELGALQARARKLKVLVFHVKVRDNEALKYVYSKAAAVAYPSVYEGFGLPVVEAMLCKVPVVTSNISSLPEAGGPSRLVDPNNVESLKSGLEKSLDETERIQRVEEGYAYAMTHFHPQKVTADMMNIYREFS